ncbi:hypothetical protein ACQ27_gp487 [Klebsiella phage K64-1]|nr:hypothetical protein ACQ27_gp487 [Klebsiella phage K64-1]
MTLAFIFVIINHHYHLQRVRK